MPPYSFTSTEQHSRVAFPSFNYLRYGGELAGAKSTSILTAVARVQSIPYSAYCILEQAVAFDVLEPCIRNNR